MGITNRFDRTAYFNQYLADSYFKNHPERVYLPSATKYVVLENRVEKCEIVTVHEFSIMDIEDPDIYAAEPLFNWEKSEKGQWVMRNAVDTPTWHRTHNYENYGYKYIIRAKLMGPSLTEWLLRYGK